VNNTSKRDAQVTDTDFKMMVPSKGNSTENQTQKYGKFHSLEFHDTVYK